MDKKRLNEKNMNPGAVKIKKKFEHWKVIAIYLLFYDIFAINFAYFFGLWLRFDFHFSHIPEIYLWSFLEFAPIYTFFTIIIFYLLHLYNSLWRFASFCELNRILAATVITTIFQMAGITIFFNRMPLSYYVIGAIVQLILIILVRFGYRYIMLERGRRERNLKVHHHAMIIGAGAAGLLIIKELKNSKQADAKPCCVIDDNSNMWGRFMEGIPIVGGRESIIDNVKKYKIDQILFAIPTASVKARRSILNICKETGCELKRLPGIYQLAKGEVSLSKMKSVAVEDLLGREPIKVDMDEIFHHIKGKSILVTGGGGSIGSELCRQIAVQGPKHLIVFDIYENSAYDIEQELKRKYPNLKLSVLIGSVRDSMRINQLFETYKPDIVYHAAAHKHVPLMENSPSEAIKNNVIGTYKTAYAALKNGTQRFVLISTDKAVNPTNVMGASKRLCEMIIQSMDAIIKKGRMDLLPLLRTRMEKQIEGTIVSDPIDNIDMRDIEELKFDFKDKGVENKEKCETQFVAVRFGNVLGSNGSVIPLFKKQIEAGGPVTVTHPDIIRYFMTIPEAISLILQASAYARGGEIFIFDMGDPVKIDTLARNLIKLSGYKPDDEIKIIYTGLRPGEKLYEEKLMAEEGIEKTDNELIHIGKPVSFDTERFLKQLEVLAKVGYEEKDNIVDLVAEIVTTFHPVENKPLAENKNTMVLQEEI